MKRKGRILFYFLVVISLILAEIFALRNLKNRLETVEVSKVDFEPVAISPQIEEAVQRCVKNISPPRTHEFAETVDISQEDAQLLMDVAWAEAGSQGTDGQWLVMSVILNRVESEAFPDSVEGVVYQAHQFTTATNGAISRAEPTAETHYALARIESGDVAPEVVAFETTDNTTLDTYFSPAFSYRGHQFYTEKH